MGDQVIALLTLPVFIAISGGLTLALRAVAPNAGVTKWLAASWPVMVAGTVIVLAVYWFVRNFFDARTGQ